MKMNITRTEHSENIQIYIACSQYLNGLIFKFPVSSATRLIAFTFR